MKNSLRFRSYSLLCLICLICAAGCGQSGLAPVSGVVTVNGKPMKNVRVVYAPMSTGESSIVGPPSLGVTDDEGRYTLKTRNGDYGAVVGRHSVTFNYDDLEHLEDLNAWYSNPDSPEDKAEAKSRIDNVKKEIARRGAISKSSKQTVTISAGGQKNADFEIGDQKE